MVKEVFYVYSGFMFWFLVNITCTDATVQCISVYFLGIFSRSGSITHVNQVNVLTFLLKLFCLLNECNEYYLKAFSLQNVFVFQYVKSFSAGSQVDIIDLGKLSFFSTCDNYLPLLQLYQLQTSQDVSTRRQAEEATRILVKEIQQAASPISLYACIEKINKHLFLYPACTAVAWQVPRVTHKSRAYPRSEIEHRGDCCVMKHCYPCRLNSSLPWARLEPLDWQQKSTMTKPWLDTKPWGSSMQYNITLTP